jgi:hypothetical protein
VDGLYKAEVIHRQTSWKSIEAAELATLAWVDWFNNRRLLEPIGNIPLAEAEANYDAALEPMPVAAKDSIHSVSGKPGPVHLRLEKSLSEETGGSSWNGSGPGHQSSWPQALPNLTYDGIYFGKVKKGLRPVPSLENESRSARGGAVRHGCYTQRLRKMRCVEPRQLRRVDDRCGVSNGWFWPPVGLRLTVPAGAKDVVCAILHRIKMPGSIDWSIERAQFVVYSRLANVRTKEAVR